MVTLFSGATPAGAQFLDGSPGITVAVTVNTSVLGNFTEIWWYCGPNNGGTWTGCIWDITAGDTGSGGVGTLLASQAFSGTPTANAWNKITLSSAVAVTATTKRYRVGVHNGQYYWANNGFFNGFDQVNGSLSALRNGDTSSSLGLINQGTFGIGSSATLYPAQTGSQANYAVDVTFVPAGGTTPFTRDYSSTWQVFNAVTRDYASTWRVLNALTRDYASTWRVFNVLTVDYSSTWRVFNTLTRDYASSWRVLNGFTVDYASSWRVFNDFLRDYASAWRVLNAYGVDYSSTWRVFNGFARDYSSTWDVLSGTAFVRDYPSTWRVFNLFSADYSDSWRVLGPFARDYSSTWRVLATFTKDYSSSWRVFRGFIRDYTSTWAVLSDTPQGLVLQVWSGGQLIAVTSLAVWDGADEIPAVLEDIVGL